MALDKLFVEPDRIGTGCGKRLWQHAVATAREMGASVLTLASDDGLIDAGVVAVVNASPEPFSNWALSFGEDALRGSLCDHLETLTAAHSLLQIMGAFFEAVGNDRHHMLVVAAHNFIAGAEK